MIKKIVANTIKWTFIAGCFAALGAVLVVVFQHPSILMLFAACWGVAWLAEKILTWADENS